MRAPHVAVALSDVVLMGGRYEANVHDDMQYNHSSIGETQNLYVQCVEYLFIIK